VLELYVIDVHLKTYALSYVKGNIAGSARGKTGASDYAADITTYVNPVGSVPEVD
jgi:hypothetical protein